MFYWTGVAVWLAIGAAILWFVVFAVADGLVCARFVIRRLRHLEHGGFKVHLPLYRTAVAYWWRLFIGSTDRPVWVGPPDGAKAYWPGRENYPETYPA